jgi:hypothetical protein
MTAQDKISAIEEEFAKAYAQYRKYSKQEIYQLFCQRVRIHNLSEKAMKDEMLAALADKITNASSRIRRIERAEK